MKQRLNLIIVLLTAFAFCPAGFGRQSDERVIWRFEMASNFAGAYSTVGTLCVDLLGPMKLIGKNVADAEGNARASIKVPANAPLVMVHTQAVAQRGVNGVDSVKSNTFSEMIQP